MSGMPIEVHWKNKVHKRLTSNIRLVILSVCSLTKIGFQDLLSFQKNNLNSTHKNHNAAWEC